MLVVMLVVLLLLSLSFSFSNGIATFAIVVNGFVDYHCNVMFFAKQCCCK